MAAADDTGVRTVIDELLKSSTHPDVNVRRPAICILQVIQPV